MATAFDRDTYEDDVRHRIASAKTSHNLEQILAHELADIREDTSDLRGRMKSLEEWMVKLDQRMTETDKFQERVFEWMQDHA